MPAKQSTPDPADIIEWLECVAYNGLARSGTRLGTMKPKKVPSVVQIKVHTLGFSIGDVVAVVSNVFGLVFVYRTEQSEQRKRQLFPTEFSVLQMSTNIKRDVE